MPSVSSKQTTERTQRGYKHVCCGRDVVTPQGPPHTPLGYMRRRPKPTPMPACEHTPRLRTRRRPAQLARSSTILGEAQQRATTAVSPAPPAPTTARLQSAHLFDSAQRRIPEPVDRGKPLVGCAENGRLLRPPVVRVLVLVRFPRQETPGLLQRDEDLFVALLENSVGMGRFSFVFSYFLFSFPDQERAINC